MIIFRHWAVPLALAGGATIGAFAMQARRHRLHRMTRQHASHVQAWENEGGGDVDTVPHEGAGSHAGSPPVL